MKAGKMTLNRRLAFHLSRPVTLESQRFFETGRLRKVQKVLIKVSKKYYVPASLNEIILHRSRSRPTRRLVSVRTTYRAVIVARLVRIGKDFIELRTLRCVPGERLLIPLNKVISIKKEYRCSRLGFGKLRQLLGLY